MSVYESGVRKRGLELMSVHEWKVDGCEGQWLPEIEGC